MKRNPDVLVAGAGPVGLFAACALAKAGVLFEVADTGIWWCGHSYALALQPATVRLLRNVGLFTGALETGTPVRRVAFYDRTDQRAEIRLDEPMIVIPQNTLESHFEQVLEKLGTKVQWRHKVMKALPKGDRVQVTFNRYEKESVGYVVARSEWVVSKSWDTEVSYLVGADGYNSAIRRSLGIDFPEVAPAAWYGVFEFSSETNDFEDEVRVVLGENTTDVLWPLGDGWYRFSFELPNHTDTEIEHLAAYRSHFNVPVDRIKDRFEGSSGDVDNLPDSRLDELLHVRARWFRGHVDEIGWRTAVRFERRLATSYGSNRCWLAGDSVHLGSPIAVASMNVGLAEANDVTAVLADAVISGRSSSAALRAYGNRYMTEWRHLQGLDTEVEAIGTIDPWIVENRTRIASCLPAWGETRLSMAEQVGLRIYSLAVV